MTTDALSTLARAFEAAAAVLRGSGVVSADLPAPVFTVVAGTPTEFAPTTPTPPVKRGRGRPVKGEEVQPVVTQTSTPAAPAAPIVAESDPFAVESSAPAAPAVTLQDVRAALAVVQAKESQAAALELFKKSSGVETIAKLTPDKYGAVFNAAIPSGKLALTDVRAVLVAAQNRISGSGTEALEEKGGTKELVKLTEDKFVAVILAAHEAK